MEVAAGVVLGLPTPCESQCGDKPQERMCMVFLVLFTAIVSDTGFGELLSSRTLQECKFELVTIDDRPLPISGHGVDAQSYWAMTAMLNYAYAKHWGYRFSYVQLNSSNMAQYHPTWGKVFYFAEKIRQLRAGPDGNTQCTWFLFLDSDAYVREFDLPLPVFLADLGRRYRISADIGAVFTEEQDLDMGSGLRSFMRGYRPKVAWLNGGVFFVHASAKGQLLFDTWEAAGRQTSSFLKLKWPGEQAVITELIRPGSYPDARTEQSEVQNINRTLRAVDMVEFNSPWGRFVVHAWTHHDYIREVTYWDALVRIRCNGPKEFAILFYDVKHHHTVRWMPTAAAIGGRVVASKSPSKA